MFTCLCITICIINIAEIPQTDGPLENIIWERIQSQGMGTDADFLYPR